MTITGTFRKFGRKTDDQQSSPIRMNETMLDGLLNENSQPTEEQNKQKTKAIRQLGFQVALFYGEHNRTALEVERDRLKTEFWSNKNNRRVQFDQFLDWVARQKKLVEEQIKHLASELSDIDAEITERKAAVKATREKLSELKAALLEARTALERAKSNNRLKWVENIDEELTAVIALQKKVSGELNGMAQERFDRLTPGLTDMRTRWQQLKILYTDQHTILCKYIDELSKNGISGPVAYIIMYLGAAMAGVAGYFFGIFSFKAAYSNNDVFNYLLKNFLSTIGRSTASVYVKIAFILGVLILVTLVSWIADWLSRKINFFNASVTETVNEHSLRGNIESDNFSYSYQTNDKRWLALWLKMVPLLLIAGGVLLILSYGFRVDKHISDLSASLEGSFIGTSIAMGLAAVVYLYLTKIAEPRSLSATGSNLLKRNWELVAIIAIFIISIAAFCFYRSIYMRSYSIVGFIASCLITAFAFAYGLRFLGLRSLIAEIEQKLIVIESRITWYTVAMPKDFDLDLEKYFKKLSKQLRQRLKDRNDASDNEEQFNAKKLELHVENAQGDEAKGKSWYSSKTSDKVTPEQVVINEHDKKYFPEQVAQLQAAITLYRDKRTELTTEESQLRECFAKRDWQKPITSSETKNLEKEIERFSLLAFRASQRICDDERLAGHEWNTVCADLQDGYNLGLWYRNSEMGPANQQLLLN